MRYYEDNMVDSETSFGRYEVTREEIIEFAKKYDPQPFHLSDHAASETHFGRISASGWHSCAMTMRMFVEHMSDSDANAGLGSPGVDNLRWLKPVHPGDVLSCRMTITAKRRSQTRPGTGIVFAQVQTLNQNDEVVQTMDTVGLVRCREELAV